ncbi:MAG: hypothetical protein K2M11_09215 [Paramuribaculum sp.]|nr:hypothetical protein [Paramuribaculum sp.]
MQIFAGGFLQYRLSEAHGQEGIRLFLPTGCASLARGYTWSRASRAQSNEEQKRTGRAHCNVAITVRRSGRWKTRRRAHPDSSLRVSVAHPEFKDYITSSTLRTASRAEGEIDYRDSTGCGRFAPLTAWLLSVCALRRTFHDEVVRPIAGS